MPYYFLELVYLVGSNTIGHQWPKRRGQTEEIVWGQNAKIEIWNEESAGQNWNYIGWKQLQNTPNKRGVKVIINSNNYMKQYINRNNIFIIYIMRVSIYIIEWSSSENCLSY